MTMNEVEWDDNEDSGMSSGSLKLDLHGNISSKPVLIFKIVLAVPKLVPLKGQACPSPAKSTKSGCAWRLSDHHPFMEMQCNRSLTRSTKNKQSNPESNVELFPIILVRKTNKV